MDSTSPKKPAPAAEDYTNGKTLDDIYELLSSWKAKQDEKKIDNIEIQQKALDDLVSVNSLFTIAVFVGLSLANPGQRSLEPEPGCDADPGVKMRLIIYEVVSFGCFLLSSLVAKTLKIYLNLYQKKEFKKLHTKNIGRGSMMSLSVVSSLIGVVFLALAMTNVVQVRIGKLSCGSTYSICAVGSLCALVLLALSIYVPAMLYATWITMKHRE